MWVEARQVAGEVSTLDEWIKVNVSMLIEFQLLTAWISTTASCHQSRLESQLCHQRRYQKKSVVCIML